MELNHNNTKQTLKTAIENEHLNLSDSDSSNSETDKPITYSSPARFHSNSDSDSIKSETDKATKASAFPESPVRFYDLDSTKSEINKATKASAFTEPPKRFSDSANKASKASAFLESPTRFYDSDSTKSKIDKATKASASANKASKASAFLESPTGFYDSDSTKSKTDKATKASALPESPARSSISSDQISLPHESLTLEDNHKTYAVPTRKPPEPPTPEAVVRRSVKEEPLAIVKADPVVTDGIDSVGDGGGSGGGGGKSSNRRRRIKTPSFSILRKGKNDEIVNKAGLGFRIFGFLFSLVSFSVMAADRNQGWALDSFERYKEFRYCMSVNIIGFVYSGAQAIHMAYQTATGRSIVQHHLRYFFDFALDQMVTYLLISASSSAATRIDDWQLNWGKDKFPDMASASVAMSFLSFAALALSSLISGYVLCNSRST